MNKKKSWSRNYRLEIPITQCYFLRKVLQKWMFFSLRFLQDFLISNNFRREIWTSNLFLHWSTLKAFSGRLCISPRQHHVRWYSVWMGVNGCLWNPAEEGDRMLHISFPHLRYFKASVLFNHAWNEIFMIYLPTFLEVDSVFSSHLESYLEIPRL